MDKVTNTYTYQKDGHSFAIRTESYGAHAFDIFVTAPDFGADEVYSFIPFGSDDIIMTTNFRYQGQRFGIKPPSNIMSQILSEQKEKKKGLSLQKIRKRKEKEWDEMHNDGGEGYNPYRTTETTPFEPCYKGDELPE